MARRADHTREELKKLILDTSWKIIGQEGIDGLTARRIAGNIGYSPGTIYNIFKSKDDLHLHINSRTLDALYKVLSSAKCNDPSKSTAQNLKTMATMYAEFAHRYAPYWFMLFNDKTSPKRESLEWYQEKIGLVFVPLENLLQPIFSSKQERKRKIAARTLWASVHGLCFLQETRKIPLISGKATTAAEMSSYLIDTFIAGMNA